MPVVGLSGPRCSASAATSSANFCFSFTTRSRPLCSYSRWRLSLDVVTWCDATKVGLQHRPNARYPAPLWLRSTRKDHKPYSASSRNGRHGTSGARARGLVKSSQYSHSAKRCFGALNGNSARLCERRRGNLGCMEFSRPPLVIAFELSEKRKAIVADTLAGASDVVYLTELDEAARAEALRDAGVLLTFNTSKELRPGEAKLLAGARLIQFMIGGVDFIPLGELPKGVPVATNGGGYAESMAEHALAMALAAAKRLMLEHENLKLGQFNQFAHNRMLAGGVCGIFGFGGIGAATGRLMHGIGMRVHAINRHGRTNERVDWIGT